MLDDATCIRGFKKRIEIITELIVRKEIRPNGIKSWLIGKTSAEFYVPIFNFFIFNLPKIYFN